MMVIIDEKPFRNKEIFYENFLLICVISAYIF